MRSTKTCTFAGCDKPHKARGFCDGHYLQRKRSQEIRPLRSQITLEQRFWIKVNKATPDGCWVWTAATTSEGYGRINVGRRARLAHRVSWEWINGTVSSGMDLDHRCGNPSCVNPAHLRPTTRSQNMQHRTGPPSNNTSGVRGVTWNKRAKAWVAHAQANGRKYYGGLHPTLEAADQAARALRVQLFTHDDHEKWPQRQEEAV